jgi:Rod binding domain-containing protein
MSTIDAVSTARGSAASSLGGSSELESTFRQVVGSVFFGQLLKSLRATVGKPAYLHGGQAEDLFQSQLDQYVIEDLSGKQSGPWLDDLYQQFHLQLQGQAPPAAALRPTQIAQPAQSAASSSLAELLEASRRTQPASEGAGITTGAAAISHLIRK